MKSDNIDFANSEFSSNDAASLMATSHVDGSVKVYKFGSYEELKMKHQECRSDIHFKDHFYAANQATFAENTKTENGYNLTPEGIGGH